MKLVVPLSDNILEFKVNTLKSLANSFLQEDLSTSIKNQTEPLIVLSKLKHNVSDNQALLESVAVLKHFFITYAILVPNQAKDWFRQELDGISLTIADNRQGQLLIASGPLGVWCDLVTQKELVTVDGYTRQVFNEIEMDLESKGLAFIFRDYNKKKLSDGTFHLEHKRG